MSFLEQSRDDPPLRAVRAFEAVARLGTVTGAARELAVSPSAVSHQLQLLERFLQLALTERDGRRLVLTDAGRNYYRSVRSVFSVLRGATEQLRDRGGPIEVHLSVIPLFGTGWLIPHLPEFLSRHPDCEVNISYANHQNYHSDSSDLSVRFGNGYWNGYESERLMSGAVTPVCSRDFATRISTHDLSNALLNATLIHDQERSTWLQWFQTQGVRTPTRLGGVLLEDGLLALAATLEGMGVALLRPALIRRELASGELIMLSDHFLDDGRDYYLCHRNGIALSPPETALRNWLLAQTSVES